MPSATRQTDRRFKAVSRYELPDLLASEDDRRRLTHEDLGEMSNVELFSEETRASFALACAVSQRDHCPLVWTSKQPHYHLPADEWLAQRVRAIRAEVARRRSR